MLTKWDRKAVGGTLAVISLALSVGCASDSAGGKDEHWFDSLVRGLSGPTPGETARQAFNSYDADRRREAINRLSEAPFGGEQPYVEAYRLLLGDPDPTVRAAAVEALGRHGTVQDAAALARVLADESAYTRWAAAQALRRIHNAQVVRPLTEAATKDTDADVRIAAADALGQYADRLVYETLVSALGDENLAVANAAHRSLQTLTGRDLGMEPGPWVQWARQEGAHLFDGQRPYTYQPYERPRSWWDKTQFWKQSPEGRTAPVGVERPGAAS